ncbi:hypothetical protein V5E97_21945 [Singulisphaera sp. Ch08]|uniref:Uncharacterized protein n=1 Tax=Singulisphaera sp. Ch08 TaxID=3120278 RepID=A0AAU7C7M5_9BACT
MGRRGSDFLVDRMDRAARNWYDLAENDDMEVFEAYREFTLELDHVVVRDGVGG